MDPELLARYTQLGLLARFGDKDGILKFFAADADGDFSAQLARASQAPSRLEELRALAIGAGIAKVKTEDKAEGEGGFSERLLTVTASDDSTDRYGDRISVDGTIDGEQLKGKGGKGKAKGWQLKEYRANPVFMAFHEYTATFSGNNWAGIPLGQALDTWVETGKGGKKSLKQTILFSDGTSNPLAPHILSAYKTERIMRAVSVGFAPLVAYWPQDDEERARLKLGPWGYVFAEQSLLENSAVSIPANPNALAECFELEDSTRASNIDTWADKAREVAPELAYMVRSGARRSSVAVPVPKPAAEPPAPPVEEKSLDAEGIASLRSSLVDVTSKVDALFGSLKSISAEVKEIRDLVATRAVKKAEEDPADTGTGIFERALEVSRDALGLNGK